MPKLRMDIPAYSPTTDTHYDSWLDLVNAEANGWVATVILSRGPRKTWSWSVGPFDTKEEAEKQRAWMRRDSVKAAREDKALAVITTTVRPLWKPDRKKQKK